MAGNSSPSGSTAYPSLLEDGHLEYSVSLTTGLLPHREEIHIPGPAREPLEVQVTTPSTQVLGMWPAQEGAAGSAPWSWEGQCPGWGPTRVGPGGGGWLRKWEDGREVVLQPWHELMPPSLCTPSSLLPYPSPLPSVFLFSPPSSFLSPLFPSLPLSSSLSSPFLCPPPLLFLSFPPSLSSTLLSLLPSILSLFLPLPLSSFFPPFPPSTSGYAQE